MQKVKVYAQRSFMRSRDISLYIDDDSRRGLPCRRLKSVEFEDVEAFEDDGPPLLDMSPESAQQLLDQLWNLGLRPSSEDGNVGMLKATQDHLKDMRAIAFEKVITLMEEPKVEL